MTRPRKVVAVAGVFQDEVMRRVMQLDVWGFRPVFVRDEGVVGVSALLICAPEVRLVRELLQDSLAVWPDVPVVVVGRFTWQEVDALFALGITRIAIEGMEKRERWQDNTEAVDLRTALTQAVAVKRGPKPMKKAPSGVLAPLAVQMEAAV